MILPSLETMRRRCCNCYVPKYQDIVNDNKTKIDNWPSTLNADCRFVSDIYISARIGSYMKVHFMAKLHDDSKIVERLTVIESRGLQVFEQFFPRDVADIANRIIFTEMSIFDELGKQKGTIKYREVVESYVHTNNDSKVPQANNYIRKCLGQTPISDSNVVFKSLTTENVEKQLS